MVCLVCYIFVCQIFGSFLFVCIYFYSVSCIYGIINTSSVIFNVLPVVCILEGSGKWPDNIDAVRRLKAAYYLSLSQALSKIAPNVLSAAYTSYLEVYKVCSNTVWLFFSTVSFYLCDTMLVRYIAVAWCLCVCSCLS